MLEALMRAAAAGLVYAVLVFGVGFVLGTIRVLILVPRMPATLAVLVETPAILAVSWWLSSWCSARFGLERSTSARLTMGIAAFTVLMLEELTLSVVLFARPVGAYLSSLVTVPGAIGLAAQVAFAFFPLLQARRRRA
jgi:hypothetical protein